MCGCASHGAEGARVAHSAPGGGRASRDRRGCVRGAGLMLVIMFCGNDILRG